MAPYGCRCTFIQPVSRPSHIFSPLQDEQNKNSFSNKTQSPSLNDPDDGCEKDDPDDDESSIGKWACFESQEVLRMNGTKESLTTNQFYLQCRVYNSYDALFYASFALIANWPLLELSLQKEIASYVPMDPFLSDHLQFLSEQL